MIDRIYNKDRRMINNNGKDNKMSTNVLTNMNKFHNLKSQTGVEKKHYDEKWLQERIDEELLELGLSLDYSPSKL